MPHTATIPAGPQIHADAHRGRRLAVRQAPMTSEPLFAAVDRRLNESPSVVEMVADVSGKDRYGRTLAYVQTKDGRDVGTVMLRQGLAIARYDGRDGYGWHPKQKKYRKLDRQNGSISCTTASKPKPKPTPTYTPKPVAPVAPPPPVSVYFANCDAVRAAGKAPIRVGDPGYGRHLDRDGDGSACE